MAVDNSSPGNDPTRNSNRFRTAIQRSRNPPQLASADDPYSRDLAERVEAQTTIESRVRLLLAELQTTRAPGRGRIVKLLTPIFEQYLIPSHVATQVWAEAAGCLSSPFVDVRNETLLLMGRCIQAQQGDLHAWQRVNYYDIIQRYPVTLEEIFLLENALYTLIDEGRNVEDISNSLLLLLARWIGFCSVNMTPDIYTDANLGKWYPLIFYIAERVFQYSYKDLEDESVTNFLDLLCNKIGPTTHFAIILEKILTVIEAIPEHGGLIPAPAMPHVLGFICMHYNGFFKKNMIDRVWDLIQVFLRDQLAQQSLRILERMPATDLTLGLNPYAKYRIRGSLEIMQKILDAQRYPNDFKAQLTLSNTLRSIELAANYPEPTVSESVFKLLNHLITRENLNILTYDDWEMVWNAVEIGWKDYGTALTQNRQGANHRSDARASEKKQKTHLEDLFVALARKFQELCGTDRYLGSMSRCARFQLELCHALEFPEGHNFVLTYYETTSLCMPGKSNWLQECETLVELYACNPLRETNHRLHAIRVLSKPINFVSQDCDPLNDDFYKRIISPLFRVLRAEPDSTVVKAIVDIAVDMSIGAREQWVIEATKHIYACAIEDSPRTPNGINKKSRESVDSLPSFRSTDPNATHIELEGTRGLVQIFEKSLMMNAPALSQKMFSDLVQLAQKTTYDPEVRFEAAEALLRLRADSMYSVYLTPRLPNLTQKEELDTGTSLLRPN